MRTLLSLLVFAACAFAADVARAAGEPASAPTPPGIARLLFTTQNDADDYFVTPFPGKPYLETEDVPVDAFHDRYRIGIDSGILYPLVAQKADYNVGWWARLYGQASLDMGQPGFRTAAEIGLGVGQSQSSRSDQPYRITSNYTFLTVRGLVDLLPTAPADLEFFAGIGIGIEFASGHVQRTVGSVTWVEESKSTNFNPLVEFGALYGFELTKGMYFTFKGAVIHPLGSRNIILFSELEVGVQFLFM